MEKLNSTRRAFTLIYLNCASSRRGKLDALELGGENIFMSAATIAKQHLDQAIKEAELAGFDGDATARYMLGWVISKYLEYRTTDDVRSELLFLADNFEPDTDFVFMRP